MKTALVYIFGTLLACQAALGVAIATDHAVISVRTLQAVGPQPQVTLAGLPNPYLAGRE